MRQPPALCRLVSDLSLHGSSQSDSGDLAADDGTVNQKLKRQESFTEIVLQILSWGSLLPADSSFSNSLQKVPLDEGERIRAHVVFAAAQLISARQMEQELT